MLSQSKLQTSMILDNNSIDMATNMQREKEKLQRYMKAKEN
jgi:hypothetical protein